MENAANINIPDFAAAVIDRMTAAGYEAFLVGGCVRDELLGRKPSDYDIATSAMPSETKEILTTYRIIETGLKHGTLTVISDGKPIEVTTFRCDGKYSDHRRPDSVRLTRKLEDDLSRRDFTVNAMAYNRARGLVDLYGGREDLYNKVIRCVGNPEKRFEEDALRILRALRFCSVLGFDTEAQTEKAIHEKAQLLLHISNERVFAEISALLCGSHAGDILIKYSDVMCTVIPELVPCVGLEQHNPHHIYDVYTHTAHVVAACPPDLSIRLAALFHDIEKPSQMTFDQNGVGHFKGHPKKSADTAEKILRRLHCDTATIREVCRLVELHDVRPEPTRKSVRRYMSRVIPLDTDKLTALRWADLSAQSPEYHDQFKTIDETDEMIRRLKNENACFKISDLDISGDDLISLGVPAGKGIGELLSVLLEAVIDEKVDNTKNELIIYTKKLIHEKNLPQS